MQISGFSLRNQHNGILPHLPEAFDMFLVQGDGAEAHHFLKRPSFAPNVSTALILA